MQSKTTTLNLSNKKLKSLNEEFIEHPDDVIHLDLSMNNMKSGRDLGRFKNMKTLILDNNFY
jgi:hypothetical protein